MTQHADYVFTVSLMAGRMLTEKGHDELAEAIDANLEGAINDAVVEFLHRELPRDRDFEFTDWFTLRIERQP